MEEEKYTEIVTNVFNDMSISELVNLNKIVAHQLDRKITEHFESLEHM